MVFSYVDEKLPHLTNERKEVPPSRTGTVQINDITDQASVSSTEMLVSNFVFAPVETFKSLTLATGPVQLAIFLLFERPFCGLTPPSIMLHNASARKGGRILHHHAPCLESPLGEHFAIVHMTHVTVSGSTDQSQKK